MMTSIKMMFSYNNNEKVVEVPVIPNELPDIVQEMANETITTQDKTLTLLGNKEPRSFGLELFLPTKHYDFAKDTGMEILELLEYVTTNKIPMRIVVTDGINEMMNIAVSVSSFKYKYDRAENIRCSANFVEYMFLTRETAEEESTSTEFRTVKVKKGNLTANVSGINDDGYNLVRTRDILSMLGIEVGWNGRKKVVTAEGKDLEIYTEVHNGCAYSYIIEIAEEVGAEIEWDAEKKTVIISGGDENEL